MGSRKNHKIRNTRKRSKRVHGGIGPSEVFSQAYKIENVDVILFLTDFLDKQELKNIVLENFKFINGIDIENNASESFDFATKHEFRKLLSDLIQWFLLDYNKEFANSILGIIKNTLEDKSFLDKKINVDERYNILLLKVCDMIDMFGDQTKIEINTLLKIILRLLVMNSIKQNITSFITTQEDTLTKVNHTIICLIDNLMKRDLLHDTKIRGILKEYIENLTYKKAFDWSNLIKLAGVVGNCAGSFTYDVGTTTAKSAYDSVSASLFSIFKSKKPQRV